MVVTYIGRRRGPVDGARRRTRRRRPQHRGAGAAPLRQVRVEQSMNVLDDYSIDYHD